MVGVVLNYQSNRLQLEYPERNGKITKQKHLHILSNYFPPYLIKNKKLRNQFKILNLEESSDQETQVPLSVQFPEQRMLTTVINISE